MNEDQLEQLCLEWFQENGWEILYGPDLDGGMGGSPILVQGLAAPAPRDYREVVLKSYLERNYSGILH